MSSGFIASPPEPASPPGAKITGGFWPDIDLNHFRDTTRTGGSTIPDARITEALKNALISVAGELDTWWADQIDAGYTKLIDVPSPEVGGEKRNVILWRRAVYATATADLIETHPDVTVTDKGRKDAEEMRCTPDEHRRNATHAIRAILGVTRTTAELI